MEDKFAPMKPVLKLSAILLGTLAVIVGGTVLLLRDSQLANKTNLSSRWYNGAFSRDHCGNESRLRIEDVELC